MEHLDAFIADLALMMLVAAVVSLLFKKLKQPVVLGYIVAGFLISPNFKLLPTVVAVEDISMWGEIGIVFLMFALGLEFSFKKIVDVGKSAIITAMTVMTAMILIGFLIGRLLGWGQMDSIFLGGMLSMSSTMIILKAYEEFGIKKKKFASLVLGTLVIEDIGGIFMMIILSTIAVSKGSQGGGAIVGELGLLILYLVLWLALGIYLIPTLLKKASKLMNDESLLIVSLAICLGMVILANVIGFSSALGAFIAGSIIGGTVLAEKVEHIIKPIKDMFGAVFFISVGMMIVPDMLVEYIWQILLITVVTIIGQMTFSTLGILISGNSLNTAIRGGFSMVQIGEFSFIIATLGTTLGVTSDFLYPIVVCVSVITTFTTPIFIKNSEKVYDFVDDKLPDKARKFIRRYTSDRKTSTEQESEWKQYLTKYVIRTLICGGGILVTYFAGIKFIVPFFEGVMGVKAGDIVAVILLLACILILTSIMCSKRSIYFTKLWLRSSTNRLPLAALYGIRIVFVMFVIMMLIRDFWNIPIVINIVIGAVIVGIAIKSDFMSSAAIKMEMQFISNLSEKQLAKLQQERKYKSNHIWLDEVIHICEIEITSEPKKKTVKELAGNKYLGILVIKILRNGSHINMPDGDARIKKGDILHILGTEDDIAAFMIVLERLNGMNMVGEETVTLKEYIYGQVFDGVSAENQIVCCPVPANKDSSFNRKPIRTCNFKKDYKGFIIGIERDNLPIINPDVDTIIETGDLLWVIGTRAMADELLLSGVLEINNDNY